VSANPQLTDVSLPVTLSNLTTLRLSENRLGNFTLPAGLTNLAQINLSDNQLTNIVLPPGLDHLETLNLSGNRLASFTLPPGLTHLTGLFLVSNLLTNLTLPPEMTQLQALGFLANPLTTLVLSEPLAGSTNLSINLTTISALQNQGVSVFTYPLTVQLVRFQLSPGGFQFDIIGPPGVYGVGSSTNLSTNPTHFNKLTVVTNTLGTILFTDTTAPLSPLKFYNAVLESPPADVPPIPFMIRKN
jgi:hypothetical protein